MYRATGIGMEQLSLDVWLVMREKMSSKPLYHVNRGHTSPEDPNWRQYLDPFTNS
jgi:hypothetical protein